MPAELMYGQKLVMLTKRHDSDPDLESGESDDNDTDGENGELIIEI